MNVKPGMNPNQNFETRLRRLLSGTRRRALGHGLIRFGAVGGLMTLAAVWAVGGRTGPGAFNGWGLSLSLLVALVCLAWNLVYRPWRKLATTEQLARRIEQEADFANLVVAAEEAERLPERWPDGTPVAAELKRRLYRRAATVLELVTPAAILPVRYARTAATGLAVALILCAVLAVLRPADLAQGMRRLLHPAPEVNGGRGGGLFAVGGPREVIVGHDVALTGVDFTGAMEPVVTEVRVGNGTWQAVPTRRTPLLATPIGLPDPYRQWQAAVEKVREDFAWRLRRGETVSAARQVRVRHHPLLAELAAQVTPPSYTRLPARDFARLPAWIEVPAGSRLRVSGRLNHPVVSAVMITDAGDSLALASDSLNVRGEVEVSSDRSFTIDLTDAFGLHNQAPLLYEVAAAPDQPPLVTLTRPDDDGILPLSGEFVLETESADDFGLTRLRLLTRTGAAVPRHAAAGEEWLGGVFWSGPGSPAASDKWLAIQTAAGVLRVRPTRLDSGDSPLRGRFRLDVRADGLDLVAGDGLDLLVEAVDNKQPAPAGRTRSARLRLQLPSAAEVLVTQDETNSKRTDELEEMRRRSRELNTDLDRLTRELMKNPVPDWARQQEMEAAIERQQKLQSELARVAEQLRRELEKLAQSQLASEAQLDKADQMSELLNQNNSAQLNELVQKLQEGGQASPEDVARAMDEVARNQQDMARRLDAALAMLKRMAQEQELDGLTALLEKMIQKQQELVDLSRQLAEQQAREEQAAAQAPAGEQAADETPEAGQEGEQKSGDQPDGEQQEGEQQEGDQSPSGDEAQADQQSGEQQDGQQQEGDQQQGDAPQPTAEELARRQEALQKEMDQLQEQLEKALENLQKENAENPSEANRQMAESVEKALDQVKKQQQENKMGKAGEQLQQMDPQKAAEMQEQALRDLGSLYSVLLKSQQAMQQAMKMEQVGSLRSLASDLLALSARQEEISQKIPPQLRDIRALDLTRSQHRLQKAAVNVRSGLSELMAEAPNRIMKLLKQLDGLIETMGSGLQAMEDNRVQVARRQARESLSQTNRIVIGLLTEAQMQGGGGGSGNPQQSLSEKLQQMAQQQAELNGVTEELRRMLADRGISQAARARMKRLGEKQAQMAGRMGELAEEERLQPEGERLLGDLAEMGNEMERISREIDDGLVSEETLVRQERILSRMLDARNSVRRRDFTSRRESQTSRRLYTEQSGRPGHERADANSPFRLKYQPLEQAPMEYRDLVRRYFAALDSLGQLAGPPAAGDVP